MRGDYKLNFKRTGIFLLVFGWLFFGWPPVQNNFFLKKAGATTTTFNTSGNWVAPAGVTSVFVEAWGGGGAGGGRGASSGQSGGGGGGAYAAKTIPVTPTTSYPYTVGAAVAGGTGNGANGNFSQWSAGADVKAAGGSGGNTTTTKGLGGTVAASVGTTIFKGGDGGDATAAISGGGGGGAGSTGAGGNATNGTAGSGTTQGGGNGAAGVNNTNGAAGTAAGGGGSGAHRTSGNRSGGGGAAGQIRITYNTAPVITVNPTESADPVSMGVNVTFTGTATDNENNWYLVVCKTNSVTPGAPPSCAGGQTYCVSSSAVASGASNNCTWTSDQSGSLNWYAFACDNAASMPTCTTANTVNSPLTVNLVISVAITSDGSIAYGTLVPGTNKSTLDLTDTQTAQNDTTIAEDFNIKTDAPAGWSLGSSASTDTFVHEFSTNGGGAWTKFTTVNTYQSLVSNILPTNSQNFDLRFTAPSPSTSSTQKTLNVTIQAVQH